MDVSEAARSRGVQVGPALRRLVFTPTFAAGLGVVVAAGLAVSMTARTVLHFTGPDPLIFPPLTSGLFWLVPLGLAPLELAPLELAPLGLAPLGLVPLGLVPLGLVPLWLVPPEGGALLVEVPASATPESWPVGTHCAPCTSTMLVPG